MNDASLLTNPKRGCRVSDHREETIVCAPVKRGARTLLQQTPAIRRQTFRSALPKVDEVSLSGLRSLSASA
jgi:hypothetical protein